MRKFYDTVSIASGPEGYAVHLDGKPVKTPGKATLSLCTAALAEAVAAEWRGQEHFIVPASMPLTQLASTAIDRVAPRISTTIDGLLEYARTDLVCYRATEPDELLARQSKLFDPLLEWFEERTGCALIVARGLMPVEQPGNTLHAVAAWLTGKTVEELTSIQVTAALASSVVIALAVAERKLTAEKAFETANCEELYQMSRWGEDEEARERLDDVRKEFDSFERFLSLASVTP